MIKFVLTFVLLVSSAFAQVCKSNQYDMLDWMAPQVATQNGHYNVVYPRAGKFYWVKGSGGFPWDVDLFDGKYIYQSITEQVWNDPNTYKIFEVPLKWMPRCVDIPTVAGKLSSIPVPAAQMNFDIHTSCSAYTVHNLGNTISELWGPGTLNVGGNIPANLPTLTLSYRYGCDTTYSNCTSKETFALQKGVGLVQWTLYGLQNGAYVQLNQSTDNNYQLASVTPVHPCF